MLYRYYSGYDTNWRVADNSALDDCLGNVYLQSGLINDSPKVSTAALSTTECHASLM